MLHKHTCIAPFINLTIDPEQNTSPCPYLGGGTWQFKDIDFQNIWKSEKFEKLRNDHLKGNKPIECNRCWKDEKVNKESARQRTNKLHNIDKLEPIINDKSYLQGPKVLTMKNGNICNLQCRICGPKDSSSWIPEAKSHLQKFPNNLEHTWFGIESFKKNWTEDQMQNFYDISNNLTRVEHYGGEPLYNKRVEEHTAKLVEQGLAKNIVLYFNTNGTHIPSNSLQQLFKNFKAIEFNISIDGIENHFEYIRHPAKWSRLLQTIEWCNQQQNFVWGIVSTVSNLNIYYIDSMLETFDSWSKQNVFLNILENPAFYSITNLPDRMKEIITKKYEGNKRLESTVAYMNYHKGDDLIWNKFLFWTKNKDSYRQQDFHFTFPEFSSII
jgi:radical SAM protein with 4Fe4S-binding SPASM domain